MTLPLQGWTVILTRPNIEKDSWVEQFQSAGAHVHSLPVIAIKPPDDWAELDKIMERWTEFGLVVFTSANSVRFFFDRAEALGVKPPQFRVAAVGKRTAEALEERGIASAFVPTQSGGAEELGKLLKEQLALPGLRVLFPKAEEAREWMPDFLTKEKAHVTAVTVYRTVMQEESRSEVQELIQWKIRAWLTFASPSAAKAFSDLAGAAAATRWIQENRVRVASIGRTTSETIRELGWAVDAEAATPSVEEMIGAMALYKGEA